MGESVNRHAVIARSPMLSAHASPQRLAGRPQPGKKRGPRCLTAGGSTPVTLADKSELWPVAAGCGGRRDRVPRSQSARADPGRLRPDTHDQKVTSTEINEGQTSVIREILMTISDRSEILKRRTAAGACAAFFFEISLQVHAFESPSTAHVQETKDTLAPLLVDQWAGRCVSRQENSHVARRVKLI
jgi:hypothetical protein